jgi:hypothetical protein
MGHTDTQTHRHTDTHEKRNETLEPEEDENETNRNWCATYGSHVGCDLLTAVNNER